MTIRYTLLVSYLLLSLASVLLITLMIFAHLRETLHKEIETKLQSQASTLMQHIDTTLFERMQNITTWSNLDMMQELRTRDVDKRLSQFLNALHTGYDGVYQQLFAVDLSTKVIASSDPQLQGKVVGFVHPWLTITLNNQQLSLHPLDMEHKRLYFSIPIPDNFQSGSLGMLYTGFDWSEIFTLLTASQPLTNKNTDSYALLIDNQRHVIATSSSLENLVPDFHVLPAEWPLEQAKGAFSTTASFLGNREVLIGFAHSAGYRKFEGFGWCVLVIQPNEHIAASIWQLWQTLLLFLGLTLFIGMMVSLWISARIANPIIKLTEFTRDFMQGKQLTPPKLKASGEVAELSAQFSQMIENLEQSKQDIVRVAKLAVIGEMAASMAHEVRTPLGILRSSAQMLQREAHLSPIGQEMIEFILSESQRLNELVTTLLECAKPKAPNFTAQQLHVIIEHSVNLLQVQAEQRQVHIQLILSAAEHTVSGDRDQLTQVFLNLIMNALQHTPKNGQIRILTTGDAKHLQISVCDNGSGISDAHKQSVFDPFFTRRQDGVGLGLTVVQQIVLAHQGKIYITDNPGGGACFHVDLPLHLASTST